MKPYNRNAEAYMQKLICETLRGEAVTRSIDVNPDSFLRECHYHGVFGLLYVKLKKLSTIYGDYSTLIYHLRPDVMAAEAKDLLREEGLRRALGALWNRGVRTLIMKGTPLAYTHYPAPALRPRADTDLLIPLPDREKTCSLLEALGYTRPNAVSGELVSSEFCYSRRDEHGVDHTLDLHWRVNNSQLFSRTFSFEELEAASIPIPALGEHARGLGNVHALLVACMHRLSHMHAPYYSNGEAHYGDRLIWLYDIHLLGEKMTPEEWRQCIVMASEKQLSAVCLDGLVTAQKKFGSAFPQSPLETMRVNAKREPMQIEKLVRNSWQFKISEFRSLPSWRDRFVLVKEHLLPPADYMLAKYETKHRALLPALYVHRALRGVYRRWRRPSPTPAD